MPASTLRRARARAPLSASAALLALACAGDPGESGAATGGGATTADATTHGDTTTTSTTASDATSDATTTTTTTSDATSTTTTTSDATTTTTTTDGETTGAGGPGASLRFFGHGVAAPGRDRVKIRVDEPADELPGPPVDVGADDFTIELWIRAEAADNPAPPVTCGANVDWIYGHVLVDRDRFNQGRKFGASIAGGELVFGVTGEGGESRTLCSGAPVTDGAWHHIALQRRRSDGHLWIFVDGKKVSEGAGPAGDVSYPDDGVPGDFCGGPCLESDPFLVIGAEKHDAGAEYPSYRGLVDELRISRVLRYDRDFTPSAAPFAPDPEAVGLYHFDEGRGTIAADTSLAAGGPSDGLLHVGGDPPGPAWSGETPF